MGSTGIDEEEEIPLNEEGKWRPFGREDSRRSYSEGEEGWGDEEEANIREGPGPFELNCKLIPE